MKQNDQKFETVCQFYALTHKLKNLLRSGWVQWKVDAKRVESVAEHIYGSQMLAFALNSEFELGVDIQKVAFMLAFHELGETVVGDITIMDGISKAQKHEMEMKAVSDILQPLKDKQRVLDIFSEFEERQTKEAKFAYFVDKFECDLQVKFHEEMGENDFDLVRRGEDERIRQERIKAGDKTLAEMWINYDKGRIGYDTIFQEFADYILKHDIFKKSF